MFDIVSNIKQKGILLINTNKNEKELNEFLPHHVKEIINKQK